MLQVRKQHRKKGYEAHHWQIFNAHPLSHLALLIIMLTMSGLSSLSLEHVYIYWGRLCCEAEPGQAGAGATGRGEDEDNCKSNSILNNVCHLWWQTNKTKSLQLDLIFAALYILWSFYQWRTLQEVAQYEHQPQLYLFSKVVKNFTSSWLWVRPASFCYAELSKLE